MNSKLSKVALTITALLVGQSALAAVSYDPSASLRLRYESKSDYNFNQSKQDYLVSQLRVGLKIKLDKHHSIFGQLQDARVFGEDINDAPSINERARNQPFADQLDLHQLFWLYKGDNYAFKLGRQKLNLGDQRLVASLEWVNTARVHDGARLTYTPKKGTTVDVFATELVSVQPRDFNDQSASNNKYFDSGFHGVYYSDKNLVDKAKVDLWWLLRENSDINDSVHTLGAKYAGKLGKLSYNVQGSVQTGEFNGQDHSAYYAHFGLSYKIKQHVFSTAYNLASGDSTPGDDKHRTFDNLYPLNHAYYGYMDMFSLQNIHNLELVYKNRGFRIGLQSFWLNETNDKWYNAGLKGNSARQQSALAQSNEGSYVGSEIDITYKKAFLDKKLGVAIGASFFFSGDYVENTANSPQDPAFLFVQTKYTF